MYIGFEVYTQHVIVSTMCGTHPRGARPFTSASLCAVQSGHTALDIAKDKGHTAIEALLQHKGAKIKSEL